jgi:hypothetical protein
VVKIIPGGAKPPAAVESLIIELPRVTPKRAVMRFDSADVEPAVKTIYMTHDAWKALGEPDGVLVTIEPL